MGIRYRTPKLPVRALNFRSQAIFPKGHGHPLLIRAAREAVLQWRYRPTLLNGEPVEVVTNIVVNFTLSQ
ncbi:MAG: energy transducer TonB [Acidobacteriaceae bacterium]|nr:energy transducer TonB [Acidobacteriaceae bacterium]